MNVRRHVATSAGLLRRALRAAGIEVGVALLVLIAGAALLVFAALAEDLLEGEAIDFDRAILLAVRGADAAAPNGPAWLHAALLDFTSFGSPAVLTLVVIATCSFLWIARKHHAALLVLGTSLGAVALNVGLKSFFDRPRPDIVTPLIQVTSPSFPSGHSLGAAAIYLMLGALLARLQERKALKVFCTASAGMLTMIVGVSRIHLGVHWPSDVLAGWCVGAAWAIACWLFAGWLQRRGVVEGAPPEVTR